MENNCLDLKILLCILGKYHIMANKKKCIIICFFKY